jgi:hypothetical protein
MGDKDDQAETNGTVPILDQHRDVRRRFVKLWNERTRGDPGEPSLAASWQPLANLLENHATSMERGVENF